MTFTLTTLFIFIILVLQLTNKDDLSSLGLVPRRTFTRAHCVKTSVLIALIFGEGSWRDNTRMQLSVKQIMLLQLEK